MAAKEVIYFRLAAQLLTGLRLRAQILPFRASVGISSQLNHHRRCDLSRDWTPAHPGLSTRGGESTERIPWSNPSGTRLVASGWSS